MQKFVEVEFFTWALDEGELLASRPGCVIPEERAPVHTGCCNEPDSRPGQFTQFPEPTCDKIPAMDGTYKETNDPR